MSQGSTTKVVSLRRECSPLFSSQAPSSSKHKFSRPLGFVVPFLGGGRYGGAGVDKVGPTLSEGQNHTLEART